MSIYGEWLAATIASGAFTSSEVNLGKDYDYLSVEIPEMDKCYLYLKVAETSGGTFYDLGKETMTNEETFNHADVWRLGGFMYIKVAATAGQTAERLIRVRGMRY